MDVERAVEIVTAEALKSSVRNHIDDGKELDNEEKDLLSSLLRVISYYSLKADYDLYYAENEAAINIALGIKDMPKNSFTVTCLEENPDGSAYVDIEVGDEVRSKLFEEGLNFMLLKAILNGDTSEILEWAQRGKSNI